MLGGKDGHNPLNFLQQYPRKEQVGDDNNALGLPKPRPFETHIQTRVGNTDVAHLGGLVTRAFVKQPRHFAHFSIGFGIAGTAPDKDDDCFGGIARG